MSEINETNCKKDEEIFNKKEVDCTNAQPDIYTVAVNKDDDNLMPNLSRTLPREELSFVPKPPNKVYHSFILNIQHLTKRIYLEMLRAIRDYDKLENIAPEEDKNRINNLKNQMEILSVAILNIYRQTNSKARLPLITSSRTPLSNNYETALRQLYDRVYHIHELTVRLFAKNNDNQIRTTLIIVLTNLKSQLRTLDELKRL